MSPKTTTQKSAPIKTGRTSLVRPQDLKFLGYRRPDGRFGARNHVVVIPVDDLSNAAAEAVAMNIRGVMALPHPYGRLQFGEDLELTFHTLAGAGRNPNIAAAIVIGIEPNWTERIVKEIAKTGKPVAGFSIERAGDLKTIMDASRKAKEFVQAATELQRELFTVKELTMSTKCGESDTTSGLASNPTVGRTFERLADAGSPAAKIKSSKHARRKRSRRNSKPPSTIIKTSSSRKVWIYWVRNLPKEIFAAG